MKKLFSMAVIFIMALTLAGCSTTKIEDLELEIDELNQEIWDTHQEMGEHIIDNTLLQDELSDTHQAFVELEAEMLLLLEELSLLQAQVFDNVITFTLEDEYGDFNSKTVGFNDEYDGTLFDLLDENLEVGYSESEWGKFIYSIEDLRPKTGAYISFSKNGVPSIVGVELSTFEDGDIFAFEVLWWDTLQQDVDDLIQLFIKNYTSDYVNSESIDYNVLLGLSLLGIENEYVTVAEVEELVESSTLNFVTDYFKAIVQLNAVDSNAADAYAALGATATVSGYGGTAYALLGLNSNTHTTDFSGFEASALTSYDTESPYDLGLDSGGITMVALSEYAGDTEIDTMIIEFATWISTDQLPSGGVETRDFGWGSSENAASISAVILGLVANGIDPRGVDYTQGTNNLISRLIEFQTDTGSFDWALTDEIDEDLMFSTPQAFLALVVYQEYVNTMSPVNPYSFK